MTLDRQLVGLLDELRRKLDPVAQKHLEDLVKLTSGQPDELLALLRDLASFDFKWTPVGMEEFVLSPEYMGLDGTRGRIFPRLLDDLIELFEDPLGYEQAVMMGGIGWGKSTLSEVALSRMVYETSCLVNPQKAYGLMDGSTIAFINASVNLKQAEKVVFEGLKNKLGASPYFKEKFPFEKDLKKEMRFPGNLLIMPVAGSEQGTVGYNVLGGVLDEVNFWQITEKSKQNRGQEFDQARHVYDMLIRRMQSRFNVAGKLPGVLLQVSSSKYPDDFTEERAREVEQAMADHLADPKTNAHPKTLVRRYSTWSTKDRAVFLPEEFYLYRGTTSDKPAISTNRDDFADKDPEMVVPVPMDFYASFKQDILGSLRDLGGFPTLSIAPFFTQKDRLMEAIERGRRAGLVHPYTLDETTLEDGAYFLRERVKFDPTKWYYAHVDLALTKDRAGVAVAHVAGWKEVQRVRNNVLVTEMEPIVVVDFMLRITPPEQGEIQVAEVRALLLELRSYGCNLRKVTYDQYQSAESRQAFERMGIESDKFSVDTTMDAYHALAEAILEGRLVMYDYAPFVEEFVRLERKTTGRGEKVDHPPKGSKDVSDAAAGAVYHATMARHTAQLDPSLGETTDSPVVAGVTLWATKDGRTLEPTVDTAGRLLPGKKLRTLDDVMWGEVAEDEGDEDFVVGFA